MPGTLRRFIFEIPAFFFVITLLEFFVKGSVSAWITHTGFTYSHPYWIGILIFALVYGLLEGFVTALMAAILVIYFSPLQFVWNPLEWNQVSILPMLFILIGSFFGIIRNQQKQQLLANQEKIESLNEQLSILYKTTDRLKRTNLNLEKKIVFRLETFQSVYEIAEQLNKLHLEQLYKIIPKLVVKYCSAETCSFYLVDQEGSLELKSKVGWSDMADHPVTYESNSDFVKYLASQSDTTVISIDSLQPLGIDAVFAVSLISPDQELIGMIKIEQIEFMNVTQDNVTFLSLLSKWFVQSIINGLRYAESEKESAFDSTTGLMREDTFWFTVKREVASAVRHKYDTALLNLHLNFPSHVDSVEKNILLHKIGSIIKKVCRIDDEIGMADLAKSYHFMILMPYTNIDQAGVVQKKLSSALVDVLENKYGYVKNEEFLGWETLSLQDGSLFLSEIVQQMIFDPILAGDK